MRSLLVVALLCGSAHAGGGERKLATALVEGDVATLQDAAEFPFYVFGLWFDTEPCQAFAGAEYTLVAKKEFPALVACLAGLSPRLYPAPDADAILYGAGSVANLALQADGDGEPRLRAFMGADPRQIQGDAAPIDSAVLGPRTARYMVRVPPKMKRRIDASPDMIAKANFRVCFDLAGKVDTVTLLEVGSDVPEFGKLAEKTLRRMKVRPFLVRGKPVRACGTLLMAYPGDRLGRDDLVQPNQYPPPPAPH